MGKSFLVIILLFSTSIVKAQTGILNYSYTVNHDSLTTNVLQLKILFNKEKSLEEILPVPQTYSVSEIDENHTHIAVSISENGKRPFVYKNFKDKKLISSEQFFRKVYYVEDTLNNIKWNISTEKKMNLKYNCTKATATFRGRDYIAWFTDEIPISNGPWKFCGLPGLIINVYDDQKIFTYELTGIDLKTKVNELEIVFPEYLRNEKLISHTKYMEAYQKNKEYLVKYSKSQETEHSTSVIKVSEQKEKF